MPDKKNFKDRLLGQAFRVVPGTDYNRVSYELREKNRSGLLQFYEVILNEQDTWDYMKDTIYPSLVRYLRFKSIDPVVGQGIVVSLFFKERFFLIRCNDFVKIYCEMERLTERAFRLHISAWLSNVKKTPGGTAVS